MIVHFRPPTHDVSHLLLRSLESLSSTSFADDGNPDSPSVVTSLILKAGELTSGSGSPPLRRRRPCGF